MAKERPIETPCTKRGTHGGCTTLDQRPLSGRLPTSSIMAYPAKAPKGAHL